MLMLQLKLRKQLRCVIWILYSCVNVTCSYYGCQVFDYWYFSTGHSLPRRRKLCLLGWTWGISVSLEHKYGKRTWSSGNIHFFPKCLAYAFKYDTMNFSFSKIIHFWNILFFFFWFPTNWFGTHRQGLWKELLPTRRRLDSMVYYVIS